MASSCPSIREEPSLAFLQIASTRVRSPPREITFSLYLIIKGPSQIFQPEASTQVTSRTLETTFSTYSIIREYSSAYQREVSNSVADSPPCEAISLEASMLTVL